MRVKFLSAWVMGALLAACNTNIAIQATGKADKVAKPKASAPSASPSVRPSASPSASAAPSLVAPSTAPPEVTNPFGFPTDISPLMPASVIATGGGNLIGQAGGNLIGQAGGNVISTGGGNYFLLATPPTLTLADILSKSLSPYLLGAAITKSILVSKEFKGLKPGVPMTGTPTSFPLLQGLAVTGLLEIKADHGLLTVWLGAEMTDEKKMITIRFTSPTKGQAIYHGLVFPGSPYMAASYDLEAGYGIADGVGTTIDGHEAATHWEVRRQVGDAKGMAMTIKSSRAVYDPKTPENAGFLCTVGHYLADGSAAVVLGIQDIATDHKLTLIPTDGLLRTDMPDKPHDFYMGPDGKDLPRESVSDALKAVMPTEADVYKPFPQMPDESYDKDKDPRFDWLN